MSQLEKIPFHLEITKNRSGLYNQELTFTHPESFDLSLNLSRDRKLMYSSYSELFLASRAFHSSGDAFRALMHLNYFNYFGVQGLRRGLLRASETIEVKLYKDKLTLGAIEVSEPSADWHHYFWNSILLGVSEDTEFLVKIIDSELFYWNGEDTRVYYDIILGFFKYKDVDVLKTIQSLVDVTELDDTVEGLDFSTNIMFPTIDVMLKIFGGASKEEYQQTIHRAAMRHFDFWSLKRLQGLNYGNISLPLSALARLAYRQFGYDLGFECDYIPEYFIKGDIPEISFEPFAQLPEK